MNWHYIFHIANYELKLLNRSWTFRVLAFIAICSIFLFHITTQSTYGVYSWSMVALASSIPWVNAFLLCLVLSFTVIFTMTERVQRKIHDTTEVMLVRPESNLEYLLGKYLGICLGFFGLSLLGIIVGGCINLFSSNAPFNFFLYIFYYFTWIIPSIAFITAFSILILHLFRHRFPALVLLLIFLFGTIKYLPGIRWDAFDYLAINQANIFSPMYGHADLYTYLLHRLAYILLAGGCLFLATRVHKRLSNALSDHRSYNLTGLLFIVAAIGILNTRAIPFRHEQSVRATYRSIYQKYHTQTHELKIPTHDITFTREKNTLKFSNRLVLLNEKSHAIPRYTLYLNPDLQVTRLTVNNTPAPFTRDHQAIVIDRQILPGDSLVLNIDYSGSIDERICYLDITDDEYYNMTRGDDVYRYGRRYIFTDEKFTLLLPECLWYPVLIPPVNLAETIMPHRDYTRFHLEVETQNEQIVLSRGDCSHMGNKWSFSSNKNMEGLSVCIGHYEKKSIRVSDFTIFKNRQINTYSNDQTQITSPFQIELYYFKGHDFFTTSFSHLDTSLVRETIEKQVGIGGSFFYPANKLLIVETPLTFASYFRVARGKSEYVQPEILFYPEYGCYLPWLSDFIFLKKHNKSQQGITDLEARYLASLVDDLDDVWEFPRSNPFIQTLFRTHNRKSEGNLLSSNPIFREPTGCIYSPHYPVLNIALKRLLKEGSASMNSHEHEEVCEYLSTRSLEDAVKDSRLDPWLLNEIIKQKGFELGNYIMAQGITWTNFSNYMEDFYLRFPHEVSFEEFNQDLKSTLHADLSGYLEEWYTSKQLPVFLVKDIKNKLIKIQGKPRIKSSVKIYNPSACGGFISLGDFYNLYTYYIPPKTSKKIKLLLDSECQIHMGLSLNRPRIITPARWSSSMRTAHEITQDSICGVFDISPDEFNSEKEIIIVDNENSNFHLKGATIGWLQQLWGRTETRQASNYIQPGITGWGKLISDILYGDTIKSAFYKFCDRGNYEAEWRVNIPDSGLYLLQAYVVEKTIGQINTHAKDTRYHYTVIHGHQKENIEIDMENQPRGWFSIGEFNLLKGEVKVILNDKGSNPEHLVVADAIKWEKINKREKGNKQEKTSKEQLLKQILKGKI